MFTGYTDGDSTTELVGSGGSGIFFLSFFLCVWSTEHRLKAKQYWDTTLCFLQKTPLKLLSFWLFVPLPEVRWKLSKGVERIAATANLSSHWACNDGGGELQWNYLLSIKKTLREKRSRGLIHVSPLGLANVLKVVITDECFWEGKGPLFWSESPPQPPPSVSGLWRLALRGTLGQRGWVCLLFPIIVPPNCPATASDLNHLGETPARPN